MDDGKMNERDQLNQQMNQEWKGQLEKRRKSILRHQIPQNRRLVDALTTMTKAELDDIRYNLCVQGISSLKKEELAKALTPAIEEFSHKWFVTIGVEQYNILTNLSKNYGLATNIDENDVRMDYMRCLGIVFNGEHEGKQAWYLPDELLSVYTKLDNAEYKKAVALNDEVSRLATGYLFYYGYLTYEQLYDKVMALLDKEDRLDFVDFMGVMINTGCWQGNVIHVETGMHYYTVMDPEKLASEQIMRKDLEFVELSYLEVYEAGEMNYIEATDQYKALAQFFMTAHSLPVLEAADVVGEIYIILQNGGKIGEMIEYIESVVTLEDKQMAEVLLKLLVDFNNSSRQWLLKGHVSSELAVGKNTVAPIVAKQLPNNVVKFVPRSSVVGRNDPCPCGSGKKYKKCCLDKEI